MAVGALPPAWTAFRSQLERDARIVLTPAAASEQAVTRDELDALLHVSASPTDAWEARILYTTGPLAQPRGGPTA